MSQLHSVFAIVAVVVLTMLGLARLQLSLLPPPAPVEIQADTQRQQEDARTHKQGEPRKSIWDEMWVDATAFFTFLVAVFTAVLAGSTILLWIATARSVALGRDEFIATHRPHIIVVAFEARNDAHANIGARLTYVNAGPTRARIDEIRGVVSWSDEYSVVRAAREPNVFTFADKWLSSGVRDEVVIGSDISTTEAIVDEQRQTRGFSHHAIICTGYIRYADERGNVRETGFYRTYSTANRTWNRQEGAEGEYSY